MSKVPSNVAQQLEESQRLMAGVQKNIVGTEPGQQPAAPTEPVIDPSKPSDDEAAATESVLNPGKTAIDPTDWKSRYDRMREKGNVKLKQANETIAQYEARIKSLEDKINTPVDTTQLELTDAQREAMTPEQIAAYENATQNLSTRQAELDARLESSTETPEDKFLSDLDSLVPDLETIDGDPAFMKWLTDDSGLGMTRMDVLKAHQSNGNAEGAASLFNAFSAQSGDQASAASQNLPPNIDVDPTQSRPTDADARNGQAEVYSQAEISDFYDAKLAAENKGIFQSSNPDHIKLAAEFAASEVKIAAAMREGRIN